MFAISRAKVLEKPNIIFGGINEHFLHAKKTEELLVGKSIFDKQVLKTALETLHNELQPDHVLPDGSPEFRKTLSEGLFYKCVLSIRPENVNPRLRSGGSILERGLSSGTRRMIIYFQKFRRIYFLFVIKESIYFILFKSLFHLKQKFEPKITVILTE